MLGVRERRVHSFVFRPGAPLGTSPDAALLSPRLQRFLADFRDLTSWVTEMKALINADELANDVAGAEALLDRHQEHKVTSQDFPEVKMWAYSASVQHSPWECSTLCSRTAPLPGTRVIVNKPVWHTEDR